MPGMNRSLFDYTRTEISAGYRGTVEQRSSSPRHVSIWDTGDTLVRRKLRSLA